MRQFTHHLKITLFTLIFSCCVSQVLAHEVLPAIVDLTIAENGSVQLDIEANAEALLAKIGPEHENTENAPNAEIYDQLREKGNGELTNDFSIFASDLIAGISLTVDGKTLPLVYEGIEVPEVGDTSLARQSIIQLSAQLPDGAQTLMWSWNQDFGSSIIRLDDATGETYSAYILEGMSSEALAVSGPQARGVLATVADYIIIGFTHIVPKGLDHILFVVGIFLASTKLRPLLIQVSSFTLAHTVTLALGILGLVTIDPRIVEPLIALSIAYVCIENIFFAKLTAWRPIVVFGFGLLHGLGFAGVLNEIGLPPSEFVVGLISFNVGVELGQLFVIAICFALIGFWLGSKHFYRRLIVIPASTVIGLVGLYWFFERIFFA